VSDEFQIKVGEAGPYLVSGEVPLTVKTPIMSEHGEPLGWKTGEAIETRARYALCRCGVSENKPFCDGSHSNAEWDGSDQAGDVSYSDRANSLGGEGIEVFDDRGTCAHAGFCGNEVTNIWKMAAETSDSRVRAQAMAMVERCPSGAITYAIDDETIEPDLPVGIAITADGPLWVSGEIAVECSNGEQLEARNRVTLCRCGQSSNKPLCDGSHNEAGFKG